MVVEEFLELFIKELEINKDLRTYYRLINHESRFYWRKAYLEQRLNFIHNQLSGEIKDIWDVGCGYATTAIFLTLNGHRVTGNTLEFYFEKIRNRLDYWSRFGNLSALSVAYANLFDMEISPASYNSIIAQDTLHHLEPIDEAIAIFYRALKPDGNLIVSEENGKNLFIQFKNFKQRGFQRISEYYDKQLGKTIMFGNENARSLRQWEKILNDHGFILQEKELEYIRKSLPFQYKGHNYQEMMSKDQIKAKRMSGIRELLYFGMNFTAEKSNHDHENER